MPQCPSLQDEIVALRPVMQAFAHRFTRSDADAEDLAQETVLKALGHLDHFTPGTSLKSWMFTILRNQYCSQYRRSKRYRSASDISEGSFENSVPSDQEWPLRLKDVSEAIDRLPKHMRQALMLVVSGRSYADAAKDCGCEIGTIKSRVGRARMALMVALDEASFGEAATR